MPTPRTCPNCGSPVAKHPENGCILAAMIQIIRERGATSEKQLISLHAKTNPDSLWNDLGQVLDKLEDGEYTAK